MAESEIFSGANNGLPLFVFHIIMEPSVFVDVATKLYLEIVPLFKLAFSYIFGECTRTLVLLDAEGTKVDITL